MGATLEHHCAHRVRVKVQSLLENVVFEEVVQRHIVPERPSKSEPSGSTSHVKRVSAIRSKQRQRNKKIFDLRGLCNAWLLKRLGRWMRKSKIY